MNNIRVTNIQRFCVNDGPGVRTVVFLHGCTLKCPWCCNPETIHDCSYFDKRKCAYPIKKVYCVLCEKFEGERSITECPIHAYEPTYTEYSSEALFQTLLKNETVYKDGGITFSGGEPLLHNREIIPVLKKLRERNIHIAMESTLYISSDVVKKMFEFVDYWLVDVKFQFGYFPNKNLHVSDVDINTNLHLLLDNVEHERIQFRMVLMHEAMKNAEFIAEKMIENGIHSLEILGYHSMAKNKYEQLGLSFHKYTPPSDEDFEIFSTLLNNRNINTTKLTI